MTLEEVTDRINPLIERAELALARLYTVSAEVPLNHRFRLRYRKVDRRWRLLLVSEDDGAEQSLVTGSRGHRLAALEKLPYLVLELKLELVAQTTNASRVLVATEAYLTELEARQ